MLLVGLPLFKTLQFVCMCIRIISCISSKQQSASCTIFVQGSFSVGMSCKYSCCESNPFFLHNSFLIFDCFISCRILERLRFSAICIFFFQHFAIIFAIINLAKCFQVSVFLLYYLPFLSPHFAGYQTCHFLNLYSTCNWSYFLFEKSMTDH